MDRLADELRMAGSQSIASSSRLTEPLLSTTTTTNNDNNEDIIRQENHAGAGEEIMKRNNKILIHGLFGRAYATRWKFWWQHLPTSICLGGFIGCVVSCLLWAHQFVISILFSPPSSTIASDRIQQEEKQEESVGSWRWIVATTGGALMASVILELPMSPKPESFQSVVHDVAQFKGNFVDSFYVIISSWIALSFGLPIGVDLIVTSIGSGVANFISDIFKVDHRTRALYAQAGLATAISVLLPSPILGLLLVQELSIATRPTSLTLSSAIIQQNSIESRDGVDVSISSTEIVEDHDLFEQVTFGGIAVAASSAIISFIFSPSTIQSTIKIGIFSLPDLNSTKFEYLDWLRAIPLGILGGIATMLCGTLYLKWNWTRVKVCAYFMNHERFQLRRIRQCFAVLAGLLCGILSFVWSFPHLWNNGVNAWQMVLEAKNNGSSAFDILHFGLHVIIGIAICIGCGVLGGCIFPMLITGAALGVGVSCPFFPLSLSVPCCMAATNAAFVPAPFTIVMTISIIFDLDSNQTISVLIASIASYFSTGGLGLMRRFAQCALGFSREENLAAGVSVIDHEISEIDEEDYYHDRPQTDYEIRQDISSTIFGSPPSRNGQT